MAINPAIKLYLSIGKDYTMVLLSHIWNLSPENCNAGRAKQWLGILAEQFSVQRQSTTCICIRICIWIAKRIEFRAISNNWINPEHSFRWQSETVEILSFNQICFITLHYYCNKASLKFTQSFLGQRLLAMQGKTNLILGNL